MSEFWTPRVYTHAPHSTQLASEPAPGDLFKVGHLFSLTRRQRLRVRGCLGSLPTMDVTVHSVFNSFTEWKMLVSFQKEAVMTEHLSYLKTCPCPHSDQVSQSGLFFKVIMWRADPVPCHSIQFQTLKTGKFCRIILSNRTFSFVEVETGTEAGSVASLSPGLGRGNEEPELRIPDPTPTHLYVPVLLFSLT